MLIAVLSVAQEITSVNWAIFKSNAGFSVNYPSSWFRKGISKKDLTILSSRGGAEAIIIKHGQAMISVGEAVDSSNKILPSVIDHYTLGTEILSHREIHNREAGTRGCRDLTEIVSKEGAVPPEDVPVRVPYIVNTGYFCELDGRKYVTVLRNFEGDSRQAAYQQIALRVAESLRAE
jgi:hypothetical protein